MRLNVGCGQTPTSGWRNLDNSFAVRLAHHPRIAVLARKLGLIGAEQLDFVTLVRREGVEWSDALHLPCLTSSVEVLYTSHMLEHLDRLEASAFLTESFRVLVPGGIIRIAVPDLSRLVRAYLDTGDADTFIADTYLAVPKPASLIARIHLAVTGPRHHHWLYDSNSLCRLLRTHGFENPVVQLPGMTLIENPDPLNLREREAESLYVEAEKPQARSLAEAF